MKKNFVVLGLLLIAAIPIRGNVLAASCTCSWMNPGGGSCGSYSTWTTTETCSPGVCPCYNHTCSFATGGTWCPL